MKNEEIIREVTRIIKRNLSKDYEVMLFGSWARGDATETSDIDIGIFGDKKVPWFLMVKILEQAGRIRTLRSIDVVDLGAKGKCFRERALQEAKHL